MLLPPPLNRLSLLLSLKTTAFPALLFLPVCCPQNPAAIASFSPTIPLRELFLVLSMPPPPPLLTTLLQACFLSLPLGLCCPKATSVVLDMKYSEQAYVFELLVPRTPLFGKVVEHLGGDAQLEDVGPWAPCFLITPRCEEVSSSSPAWTSTSCPW